MKQPTLTKFSRLGRLPILTQLIGMMTIFGLMTILPINATASKSLYLIGDFNNWKLPTLSDTNGAVKFEKLDIPKNNKFRAIWNAPKGDSGCVICHMDDQTGEIIGFGGQKYRWQQTILTDYSGATDAPQEWREQPMFSDDFITSLFIIQSMKASDIESVNPYLIKDWTGDAITVMASNTLDFDVQFSSEYAPEFALPTPDNLFYAIIKSDEFEPQIIELNLLRCKRFQNSFDILGSDISVTISTEKSLTPSQEHVWGVPESTTYEDPADFKHGSHKFPMVKGGESYHFRTTSRQSSHITIDWTTLSIDVASYDIAESIEQIWAEIDEDGVISSKIECNIDPTTGFTYPIRAEGKNVKIYFHSIGADGTIGSFGPCTESVFMLPTDETFYNVGYDKQALYPDGFFEATFKDSGVMEVEISPTYNLAYTSYEGALSNTAEIEFISDEFSIDAEAIDSNHPTFYDLNGRAVTHPEKGIYIRELNGRYEKVVL